MTSKQTPVSKPPKRAAQQHDLYCRAGLSDLAVADELLRLFLGQELGALIEDGPPTLEPGNHVDEDSRASRPDFRFVYRRKGGGRVRIVLEHKSWCDPGTPEQLCRYAAQAVSAKDRQAGDLVILVVLYHGEADWSVPCAAPAADEPRLPQGAVLYHLMNLMRQDLEALAHRVSRKTWTVATAMVGAFAEPVRAPHLDNLLRALPASGAFMRQTLKYISGAWGIDKDELHAKLAALRPEEGTDMAGNTLWDIEDRAEARGKAQGIAEGMAEGKAEGIAETLLALMRQRFSGLPDDAARQVRSASAQQLDAWTAAVLTANNLDELLATSP